DPAGTHERMLAVNYGVAYNSSFKSVEIGSPADRYYDHGESASPFDYENFIRYVFPAINLNSNIKTLTTVNLMQSLEEHEGLTERFFDVLQNNRTIRRLDLTEDVLINELQYYLKPYHDDAEVLGECVVVSEEAIKRLAALMPSIEIMINGKTFDQLCRESQNLNGKYEPLDEPLEDNREQAFCAYYCVSASFYLTADYLFYLKEVECSASIAMNLFQSKAAKNPAKYATLLSFINEYTQYGYEVSDEFLVLTRPENIKTLTYENWMQEIRNTRRNKPTVQNTETTQSVVPSASVGKHARLFRSQPLPVPVPQESQQSSSGYSYSPV
ncbi:MAG: hypothetical protein KDH94_07760, partial [Coxiellaceae bacterium]|nr:hypothetical protein [Coxiellaceae bacterium]